MAKITHWMQRYILISWMILCATALVAAYWALDRTPPFVMDSYTVSNAPPGYTAYVDAHVQRNLGRDCTVNFSRYLVDSHKVRHDLGGTQYMSAAALRVMERDMPDSLRLAVRLPDDIPAGPASLVTALEYRCNPVHGAWPIDVLLEMQLQVLP